MSKIILIIGAVIIIGLGAVFVLQPSGQELEEETTEDEEEIPAPLDENEGTQEENEGVMGNVIIYSDSGFSPQELIIKAGEMVTFRNESSRKMWPATALHPSHTVYPGSNAQKCFDEQADKDLLFDACSDREEWSFVFNETGSWNYHNHRRSSERGTIIVE